MSRNPYAPPMAAVADVLPESKPAIEPPFFAVSIAKLLIMTICTMGLYEVYWFYRNWQRVRELQKVDVFPATRAVFAPFYCYQLFARVRDHEASAVIGARLAAGPLAIGFSAITLLSILPDPYWWLSQLACVFLLPVQAHVNRLNVITAPTHNRNAAFTGWNWLAIVLGSLFVAGALAGTFLVPEGGTPSSR